MRTLKILNLLGILLGTSILGCSGLRVCSVLSSSQTYLSLNENTVYVIRDNIDLGGDTLVVPKGCLIQFDGGSIRNGVLFGNNTKLKNLTDDCLLCDFAGTFSNMSIKVSCMGLHPMGDGTVANTPNQHSVFERINSLLPCVHDLVLEFENGYYGFGSGAFKPQGLGQAGRLWYGYYALYYFDYTGTGITESLRIIGNGARLVNVFPYYVGAWRLLNGNMMTPYLKWNNSDKDSVNAQYATESGGFLYYRTNRKVDLSVVDLQLDMHKEIMQYGGYQRWTQRQSGLFFTTKGDIYVSDVVMQNNVSDGMLVVCHSRNGEDIIPRKVEVKNSRFINNTRLGLSLSAGTINNVKNCYFASNGRINDINGYYAFESPWADIDIEPLVGKESVTVKIDGCHFVNSNVFCVVSSHQNIKSFTLKNCVAENDVPRLNYRRSEDKEGNVAYSTYEIYQPTIFMQVHASSKLVVNNLRLIDVAFYTGNSFICKQPGKTAGAYDGELLVKSKPTVRASASNISIISGQTYNRDYPICLLEVDPKLINYKYDASLKKWVEIDSTIPGVGYGGWNISSIEYHVGSNYGVLFKTADNDDGSVKINDLTLVLNNPRVTFPLFSGKGIPDSSGITIKRLEIVDNSEGAVTLRQEPILHDSRVRRFTYRRHFGVESPGIMLPESSKVKTIIE